jgi:hypothetical protein
MTDTHEESNLSPTQQVIAETIRLLSQQGIMDEGVIENIKRLNEAGRLSKPKDVAEVLKPQGVKHENIANRNP